MYRYDLGDWHVRVTYELQPGWRFVSKQISIERGGKLDFQVHRIDLFRGRLAEKPVREMQMRSGAWLRFGTNAAGPDHGLFLCVQTWNGTEWQDFPDQVKSPAKPLGSSVNTVTFPAQTTSKFRVMFVNDGRARSGLTEIMAWRE